MPWQFTTFFCLLCMILMPLALIGFFGVQTFNRRRRNDSIWLVEYLEQEAQERQRRYIWFCIFAAIVLILPIATITILLNSI